MPFSPSQLDALLPLLALGAARTVPMVWVVPAFGGPALPVPLRLAFGVGLACLTWPALAAGAPPLHGLPWLLLATREVLVGVVMGFVCACVFRAAEAAGGLSDGLRGGNAATLVAAAGAPRSSPLGVLLLLLTCAIFFEIGGAGHTATALARSYDAIPLDSAVDIGARARDGAWIAVAGSGKLIEAAVGLAAPVMLAALLSDLVLGAVARAVPRSPVHALGLPVKALLGLAAVLVALAGMDLAIQGKIREFFGLLDRALRRSW